MCCLLGDANAYEVGIPHPNGILHTYLPHQQTIHPSERELHELDVLGLQVCRQGS